MARAVWSSHLRAFRVARDNRFEDIGDECERFRRPCLLVVEHAEDGDLVVVALRGCRPGRRSRCLVAAPRTGGPPGRGGEWLVREQYT